MTPPPDRNDRSAIGSQIANRSGGGVRAVLAIARLVITEIFRKKDFYVALILIGVILFWAQGLQFYHVENISRYLMEMGLALIYFFSVILTTAIAARQYPAEIQNRTGAILFAKPVSRAQFVLGKFLGSFFAGAAAFTAFYILFLAVVWVKAGELSLVLAAQAFYLFLLNLLVLSAMVGFFSYGLTVSANVTISLVIYLLIDAYGAGLRESAAALAAPARMACEAIYFAWPHFEFFDLRTRFIHDWPALPSALLLKLTVYALAYAAAFLLLACAALKKRPL